MWSESKNCQYRKGSSLNGETQVAHREDPMDKAAKAFNTPSNSTNYSRNRILELSLA